MTKIKAVLFDFDGTLIDSEHFHFSCWNAVLSDYGIALEFEDYIENFAGVPTPANAERLISRYQLPIAKDALIDVRETLTNNRLKTHPIKLMPYAMEVLEFFQSKNLPLAVVTGSPREDVDVTLKRTGLKRFFEVTITRSDVQKSKPEPESYEKCMQHFGFNKEEYLVFEDTVSGVKSAKAAGLTCLAVHPDTSEHTKLQMADKIFHHLNEAKAYVVSKQWV